MKIIWIKKIMFPVLIMSLFIFFSCERNQNNQNSTSETEVVRERDEAGDIDDNADYSLRRQRAEENIDSEISRYTSERDSLLNQNVIAERDKTKVDQRIIVLEERISFLKKQKNNLENEGNDQSVLEKVEANLQEVLEKEVETREKDRTQTVRGEGTSLDGPDLNETGTRTGTEVERRQKSIIESIDQKDTTDEDLR